MLLVVVPKEARRLVRLSVPAFKVLKAATLPVILATVVEPRVVDAETKSVEAVVEPRVAL